MRSATPITRPQNDTTQTKPDSSQNQTENPNLITIVRRSGMAQAGSGNEQVAAWQKWRAGGTSGTGNGSAREKATSRHRATAAVRQTRRKRAQARWHVQRRRRAVQRTKGQPRSNQRVRKRGSVNQRHANRGARVQTREPEMQNGSEYERTRTRRNQTVSTTNRHDAQPMPASALAREAQREPAAHAKMVW